MLFDRKTAKTHGVIMLKLISVLLVADVVGLCRIEEQVADRSDQRIDAKGNVSQDKIEPGSGGEAFGLERGVVYNKTTNPAEEKRKNKTNNFVAIHN